MTLSINNNDISMARRHRKKPKCILHKNNYKYGYRQCICMVSHGKYVKFREVTCCFSVK